MLVQCTLASWRFFAHGCSRSLALRLAHAPTCTALASLGAHVVHGYCSARVLRSSRDSCARFPNPAQSNRQTIQKISSFNSMTPKSAETCAGIAIRHFCTPFPSCRCNALTPRIATVRSVYRILQRAFACRSVCVDLADLLSSLALLGLAFRVKLEYTDNLERVTFPSRPFSARHIASITKQEFYSFLCLS